MGEASHPRPATPSSSGGAEFEARGSPLNQELLQYLEQDSSTRTRRRVRRRVRDSDSDAPLMQVDLHSGEEGRGQVGQRRVVLVPEESPQSVQDLKQPSAVLVTIPASSGTVRRLLGHNVERSFKTFQLDSDDTILVGERNVDTVPHRAATADVRCRVGCVHPTNTSALETEVDLQSDDVGRRSAISALQVAEPGSTVHASSGFVRNAQHPAHVVVPASGGIQLHNSFEVLSRNDEDDVTIDGYAVFFGDESETVFRIPIEDMVNRSRKLFPWKQDPDLSTSVWRPWMELIYLKNSTNAHTR